MRTYVHGVHDQVHHSGKDTLGRSLQAGKRYLLSQPGQRSKRVSIVEDESTCELYLRLEGEGSDGDGRLQRVDECSCDCGFSQILQDDINEVLQATIADQLTRAATARQDLAHTEQLICNMLGCEVGDMTTISDTITAAVRDGLGTAFDLVQMHSCS